jgi:hypothetical protein
MGMKDNRADPFSAWRCPFLAPSQRSSDKSSAFASIERHPLPADFPHLASYSPNWHFLRPIWPFGP